MALKPPAMQTDFKADATRQLLFCLGNQNGSPRSVLDWGQRSCDVGAAIQGPRFSKRQDVRVFQDQAASGGDVAVGRLLFVVDDEQVAQWTVDQIESNVRAELLQIGVVLQQRVEKRSRVERVADPRRD